MAKKKTNKERERGHKLTAMTPVLSKLVAGIFKATCYDHPEYGKIDPTWKASFVKRLTSALLSEQYVSSYREIVLDGQCIPKPCNSGAEESCSNGMACLDSQQEEIIVGS